MNSSIVRKMEEKDVDGMLEWMHDASINCFFSDKIKKSNQQTALEFIRYAQREFETGKSCQLSIIDEKDEYIGSISLRNIDKQNGTAEYAVAVRKCGHGKGFAKKATEELLRFSFEEMNLRKVYLNVMEDNGRAICFYEKCGFQWETTCEEDISICINGERKEQRRYSVSKSQWLMKKEEECENESDGK